MSKYTGKPVTVDQPAAAISEKFSDLTRLGALLDKVPESEREKLGQVSFTPDSIVINTQQVGNVSLKVVERTADKVKFQAVGSPVPIELVVDLKPLSDTSTEVTAAMDLQIPMMLRPMVAPHIQKAVDMLSGVIGRVADL